MKELKIIVPKNCLELGELVCEHLKNIRGEDVKYIIDTDLIRFNNGEGKCTIKESLRDKDIYILSDVSNSLVSYKLKGEDHYMGPDEHFMDIIRILSAECGHAAKRTLIMPYLYSSRQDRKDSRESLDCATALRWLVAMGVDEIVTCDIHNKGVMNAIPFTPFENMYLTDIMLETWIKNENIRNKENIICVSPDEGATKRARFLSEVLDNASMGMFYKYRSPQILDGNGQIKEHRFLGDTNDLIGKTAIVTDDMIDTGGSILDTAKQLKELGASKVYLMSSFAFFSRGTDKFDEYYNLGYFDKVYASNVVNVPENIKNKPWFELVDCSYNIANIINELNYGRSIGEIIQGRDDVLRRVRQIMKEKK